MDRGHLRYIWEKSMVFLKINTTSKKSIGVPGTHGTPPGSVPTWREHIYLYSIPIDEDVAAIEISMNDAWLVGVQIIQAFQNLS